MVDEGFRDAERCRPSRWVEGQGPNVVVRVGGFNGIDWNGFLPPP